MSPTFQALSNRNYRLYAAGGVVSNTGTWMQRVAQDWLVLQLTGNSGAALGITTGSAVPADAAALAVRRPGGRPVPEAPAAPGHPADDGRPRADPRRARRHRGRPDVARLRARLRVRGRHRLRRSRTSVVRQRDGRAGAAHQRGRPQQRLVQRRPHRRPGAGRLPHRSRRLGRACHRLGDPRQRAQLRRGDLRAAEDAHRGPRLAGARGARRQGDDRGGDALRARPPGPDADPRDRLLRRHLRPQLPDDLGADGDRRLRQGRVGVRPARHHDGDRLALGRPAGRPARPAAAPAGDRGGRGVRRGGDARRRDAVVPHLRSPDAAARLHRADHDHGRERDRAAQHRADDARPRDGALHDDLHGRHPRRGADRRLDR